MATSLEDLKEAVSFLQNKIESIDNEISHLQISDERYLKIVHTDYWDGVNPSGERDITHEFGADAKQLGFQVLVNNRKQRRDKLLEDYAGALSALVAKSIEIKFDMKVEIKKG